MVHKIKEDVYVILKQNSLFSKLNDTDLYHLYKDMKEIRLQSGQYLMRENDPSHEFYVLLEGTLEITKVKKGREYVLNQLHKGDTIGEMSLFDNDPRSASVKATSSVHLLSLSFEAVRTLAKDHPSLLSLITEVSKKISSRLRYNNEITLKALEEQLEQYKVRVAMANFIVSMILFLVFYIFIQVKISVLLLDSISTKVGVFVLLGLLFFIIILIRSSNIPFAECGITLRNWKVAIYESVLFTIPILIFILFLKWILMHTGINYLNLGQNLFDPYVGFRSLNHPHVFPDWITSLLLYALISAPLQELIVRGGLQTPLSVFLTGKHIKWKAILISNVIFSSFHVVLSIYLALMVLLPGIFWGWLYSRHRTLIGVWLSHALIGIWAFWLVGLWFPLT